MDLNGQILQASSQLSGEVKSALRKVPHEALTTSYQVKPPLKAAHLSASFVKRIFCIARDLLRVWWHFYSGHRCTHYSCTLQYTALLTVLLIQAWLGYYKGSLKLLKWTPVQLVQQANEFSRVCLGTLYILALRIHELTLQAWYIHLRSSCLFQSRMERFACLLP